MTWMTARWSRLCYTLRIENPAGQQAERDGPATNGHFKTLAGCSFRLNNARRPQTAQAAKLTSPSALCHSQLAIAGVRLRASPPNLLFELGDHSGSRIKDLWSRFWLVTLLPAPWRGRSDGGATSPTARTALRLQQGEGGGHDGVQHVELALDAGLGCCGIGGI